MIIQWGYVEKNVLRSDERFEHSWLGQVLTQSLTYLQDSLYKSWCRWLPIPVQNFKLLSKVTEQLTANVGVDVFQVSDWVSVQLLLRSLLSTYPQSPLVSATMTLTPFWWQKSPKRFWSSREESVSTTTWNQHQTLTRLNSSLQRWWFYFTSDFGKFGDRWGVSMVSTDAQHSVTNLDLSKQFFSQWSSVGWHLHTRVQERQLLQGTWGPVLT